MKNRRVDVLLLTSFCLAWQLHDIKYSMSSDSQLSSSSPVPKNVMVPGLQACCGTCSKNNNYNFEIYLLKHTLSQLRDTFWNTSLRRYVRHIFFFMFPLQATALVSPWQVKNMHHMQSEPKHGGDHSAWFVTPDGALSPLYHWWMKRRFRAFASSPVLGNHVLSRAFGETVCTLWCAQLRHSRGIVGNFSKLLNRV